MERVTLKMIALRAGVTVSCVSQALCDQPGIGAATKERICKLAAAMGYRPDPALGALVAYRAGVQPARFRSLLAWVTDPAVGYESGTVSHLAVVQKRAAALGYELDVIPMESPRKDWERVLRIIRARGIRGILLASRATYTEDFPDVPVKDLCLATVGYSVHLPGIHRVSTNQYLDMFQHLEHLTQLGYERIGLWVPPQADGRVNHQFSGGYLAWMQAQGRVPPAICSQHKLSSAALRQWVKEHRFDVIVGWTGHLAMLREAGFDIPGELGFSTFDWHGGEAVQQMSGMDYRPSHLIAGAVDVLHGLLLNNRTGLSADYPLTLYNGHFIDGPTTRNLL